VVAPIEMSIESDFITIQNNYKCLSRSSKSDMFVYIDVTTSGTSTKLLQVSMIETFKPIQLRSRCRFDRKLSNIMQK
jgi:hypothetical protein